LFNAERVVVTGMAINTPLGDTLEGFLEGLLAGRSAITRWRSIDTSRIYAKVGADLRGYDIPAAIAALRGRIPDAVHDRLRRLAGRAPWSTQISMLLAAEGFRHAGLFADAPDPYRVGVIVAGHNINANYIYENASQFREEPDFIDGLFALHSLDTDHAGSVSELLNARGPIYTVGGACASGNIALRAAVDELRYHDVDVVIIVGAALDFAPTDLHAMVLMGAITHESFNDAPALASRPFDTRREGFVPAHGGGVLVVERRERAERRGAVLHAGVVGVEASADANHLPQPSAEGQNRLMAKVLAKAGLEPEQIDFVSAHATSTPLGDLTEIQSIERTFGAHAAKLRINAPKSILGHTCWAAPVVESIAAILQMNAGQLHPSINIDELDPRVQLDVCRGRAVHHDVRRLMKNSFGFGGINSVSILERTLY